MQLFHVRLFHKRMEYIRDAGFILAPAVTYSQNGHVSTTAREQAPVSRGPKGAQADPRRR